MSALTTVIDRKLMNGRKYSVVFMIALAVLSGSCKKMNADYDYDYRRNPENNAASNVRLVNMSLAKELVINGDSLTSFFVPSRDPKAPIEQITSPGTHYFPKNGRLSGTWNIPQELLSQDGSARVLTYDVIYPPSSDVHADFLVNEQANQPKDYYLLYKTAGIPGENKSVVEVPRDITAPSRPDYIKIRIVNMAANLKNNASPMEELEGPVTLAYADGTPVHTATSGITPGNWSQYVEVPYGTYQFKVLAADGRQLPGVDMGNLLIDPPTSTIAVNGSTKVTYGTVQTYQPGGVYSIVVRPEMFTYPSGIETLSDLQNAYETITDISEPANNTYTRIQLANGLPGSTLSLKATGADLAEALPFSSSSAYKILVTGKYELSISDASGAQVALLSETLSAGNNYTLWVYPNATGQAQALLVSNNLSSSWFAGNTGTGSNASLDRRQTAFPFQFRFLNLCPDIPYLSFTNQQGQPFSSDRSQGASNLQPGVPLFDNPYVNMWTYVGAGSYPAAEYHFLAYQSEPGKLPGTWLKTITPLSSTSLVAKPELYTNAGRPVPPNEPGIYTIAVAGRYTPGSAVTPAFMVVKHTK